LTRHCRLIAVSDNGPAALGIAIECELMTGDANSRRYFVGDFYARLFPPHRNEHHRFVICVRDADKPVNAFLLQPLAYRLLQYAPVGAMKYLHFHLQRFS
jgi:hypothetical protein